MLWRGKSLTCETIKPLVDPCHLFDYVAVISLHPFTHLYPINIHDAYHTIIVLHRLRDRLCIVDGRF